MSSTNSIRSKVEGDLEVSIHLLKNPAILNILLPVGTEVTVTLPIGVAGYELKSATGAAIQVAHELDGPFLTIISDSIYGLDPTANLVMYIRTARTASGDVLQLRYWR